MNKWFLGILALVLSASGAHSQTQFVFGNVGENGSAIAPVYGPEPGNPDQQKWGNTPGATPSGTQSYSGLLLDGSNYSVEAWYSLTPVADMNSLCTSMTELPASLTTFLSSQDGFAGYFDSGGVSVPGSVPTGGAYLQVRAWDNNGGQFNSWSAAWNAAHNGSGPPVGWSEVFWQPVGGFGTQPPGMFNFESFNTFIAPEPSALALLSLSAAALFIARRHR